MHVVRGKTIDTLFSAEVIAARNNELAAQIKAAEAELATAPTPEERSYAQEIVSGLLNLAMEAGQINGGHIH